MIRLLLRWLLILLAALNFGFMAFDGGRALLTGSYITPQSGEHTGALGPWKDAVAMVGVDPASTFMKVIFLVWGLTGLFIACGYLLKWRWSWAALFIINVLSLWYLYYGTASSLFQIVLLLILWLGRRSKDE